MIKEGRIMHVAGDVAWLANGMSLLKSTDRGETWTYRASLPAMHIRERLANHRLGRRLGRVGFHHFLMTGIDSGIVIAHRHLFFLPPEEGELKRVAGVVGSRPLSFCAGNGIVCYGEYRDNRERSPVHIWASDAQDLQLWEPVWQFDSVRHVHGVFFDSYSGSFWITTGDRDKESAIWSTADRFRTMECIVGGAQQYRAVQLLFTDKYIYYGSDAPDERNYIYRLDRSTGKTEVLIAVGGPVFYGCKVQNWLFFSTVVEPSKVNRSSCAEVWGSLDGMNWHMVCRFRKDFWPMKYFQYGQVFFPAGKGDGENLWLTPVATENDQITLRLPVLSLLSRS